MTVQTALCMTAPHLLLGTRRPCIVYKKSDFTLCSTNGQLTGLPNHLFVL